MSFKQIVAREVYVAIHAQSARFRFLKYCVLLALLAGIYTWGGGTAVAWFLGVALVFALGMHFVFRWKTKAWTQTWGPYQPLKHLPSIDHV